MKHWNIKMRLLCSDIVFSQVVLAIRIPIADFHQFDSLYVKTPINFFIGVLLLTMVPICTYLTLDRSKRAHLLTTSTKKLYVTELMIWTLAYTAFFLLYVYNRNQLEYPRLQLDDLTVMIGSLWVILVGLVIVLKQEVRSKLIENIIVGYLMVGNLLGMLVLFDSKEQYFILFIIGFIVPTMLLVVIRLCKLKELIR